MMRSSLDHAPKRLDRNMNLIRSGSPQRHYVQRDSPSPVPQHSKLEKIQMQQISMSQTPSTLMNPTQANVRTVGKSKIRLMNDALDSRQQNNRMKDEIEQNENLLRTLDYAGHSNSVNAVNKSSKHSINEN